jgi:hypothetical protein
MMPRFRDRLGALALIAVVLVVGARPSHAQTIAGPTLNAQAQAHFDKALAAYSAANYHAASVEFELAYNLDARRELLFAWAQAERLAGNCDRAVVLYRRFLDQGPSPEEAAKAGRQIERCRPAAAARPDAAAAALPASSVTTDSEPRSAHWYSDRWADALVVAGLVAGIAGGAFIGLASSDDAAAGSASQYGAFRQLAEDADRHRLIGGVALASGTVLVTAGVLVYFWRGRSDESVARRWSPTLGLGSVGVAGAF